METLVALRPARPGTPAVHTDQNFRLTLTHRAVVAFNSGDQRGDFCYLG